MARIPFVTPADIAPHEQPAFDEFVRTRGAFPDTGPYATMAHLPDIALKVDALRLALRDEASLTQPIQELVMITVAREMDCGYIWHAHAAAAQEEAPGVAAGTLGPWRPTGTGSRTWSATFPTTRRRV